MKPRKHAPRLAWLVVELASGLRVLVSPYDFSRLNFLPPIASVRLSFVPEWYPQPWSSVRRVSPSDLARPSRRLLSPRH